MSIAPNTSPRVPSAAAPSPRRWRDLALLLGLVFLVILGLASLAMATGWAETMAALPELMNPKRTSLRLLDIFRCLQLKVWDVKAQRMISLREIHAPALGEAA